MQTPKELHRYFKWENGLKMLNNGKLPFSIISSYNDPFEMRLASSFDLFKHSSDEMRKELIEYIQTPEGKNRVLEFFKNYIIEEVATGTSLISSSLTTVFMCAYLAKGASSSFKKQLSEIEKLRLYATKYYPLIGTAQCCCFSAKEDDILMWSHYAGSHTGIVVTFDIYMDYWHDMHFKEVVYSNERVDLPEEDIDANEYAWQILTRKAECWRYEQEYRALKFGMQEKYCLSINPKSVTAIRLGVNVNEAQREEILRLRDTKYKDAVVYQTILSEREFKLEFEEL